MKLGEGWDDSIHRRLRRRAAHPPIEVISCQSEPLRTRSAAPGTGRRRCGSRAAPRSPAGPPAAARSRAATSRSSRSTCPGTISRSGQPCSAVSGSPSACVASIAPSRSRNSTGTFAVKPASAWAIAKRALGRCPTSSRDRRPGDPGERRVEPAPARDAVDVLRHLDSRQLVQLLPVERDRGVDLAGDPEVPAGEVGGIRRDRAGMEDRPLLGQVLARR